MDNEALVVFVLIGLPVLLVAAPLLALFARLMYGLPLIISVPLAVLVPPLFVAFIGGVACCLLFGGLAGAGEKLGDRRESIVAARREMDAAAAMRRAATSREASPWFD